MASEADLEIQVKTIDRGDLEPLAAYQALRSFTPGRPSFLLESGAPDHPEGRYSILGYRARKAEMQPPALDAIEGQARALQGQDRPETFAKALCLGSAGFFSYGNVHTMQRVRPWDDEGPSAHFIQGCSIAVFDHQENTIVIAATAKGNRVERCLWEMTHGPGLPALDPSWSDEGPRDLRTSLADDKLGAKAARARPYLGDEVTSLTLAQTFIAPLHGGDPLHAYRALRAQRAGRHGFYLDMGESPVSPPMQLMGTTEVMLYLHRRGDAAEAALGTVLAEALPHANTTGPSRAEAAPLIRRLEESTRGVYGGAVGYLCPGGEAAFALADHILVGQLGHLEHPVSVLVDEQVDASALAGRARAAATEGLRAMRAAQDAAGGSG